MARWCAGFYASAFSLLGSATAYPVINSAAFYLDDFPSPVPSGDATYIKRDYGMSIADFYSKVWWPDLTKLAERYGIRFTGVMIENYGDDTKDAPVRQKDESHFSYFGGLLLKQNGEIGYHGYNHQPLVLPNTDYGDEYAYHQWPNRKAVVASLRELIAFQKSVLPAASSVGICAAVQHPVQGRTADNRTRRARNPHHRQHLPAKRQQTALRAGIRCGR